MQQTPYKPMAQELAKYGRYGDSMMVHMNPVEVAGLASLSPTGQLTTNPVTGQPEAFLPFLAPLLGSVVGTAFLPGLASAAGLGGLGAALAASPALAGAIGSGLATTLESGSLEKGLISGITGYGLGSALGAAGKAATGAEGAITDAATGATMNALPEAAVTDAITGAQMSALPGAGADVLASTATTATPSLTEALRAGTQNVGQMLSDPGAIGSALMKPGTLIPAGIGINQMETMRLQEEMKDQDLASQRAREQEYQRAKAQMEAAMYPNLQYPELPYQGAYSTRYGMGGGIVDMLPSRRMQEGGSTNEEEQRPAVLGPPEGYRPGIDPEYVYDFTGAGGGRFGGVEVNSDEGPVEQFTVEGLTGTFGNVNPDGDPFIPGITSGFGTNLMADPLVGSGTTRREIIDEIMTGSFGSTGDRGLRSGIEGDRFGRPLSAEMAYRAGAPEEAVRRLAEQEDARRRAGQNGYAPEGRVVEPPTEEQQAEFLARQQATQTPGGMYEFLDPEVRARLDRYNNTPVTFGPPPEPGQVSAQPATQPATQPPAQADTSLVAAGGIGNVPLDADLERSIRAIMAGEFGPTIRTPGGIRMGMQEGGMTQQMDPQLVEMTAAVIRGEITENADQIVDAFLKAYGNDAFMQLREQVLQSVVPGAQTQGMIRGQGGGMDDEVMGMIGNNQPVAVSPGEYIVPADAVSGMGDGSSDAGAAKLDELVENVRRARTGTAKQPAPIKESMGGKV